jgi:hypothetical protein
MENSYGIGVTNRFMLALDEDVDPFEILKSQEESSSKAKAAAKKDAKAVGKDSKVVGKDAKAKGTKAVPKKGSRES